MAQTSREPVVHGSRIKPALYAALMLPIAALLSLPLLTFLGDVLNHASIKDLLVGSLIVCVAVLPSHALLGLFLGTVLRPPKLQFCEDGLRCRTFVRTRFWRWCEILDSEFVSSQGVARLALITESRSGRRRKVFLPALWRIAPEKIHQP